MVILGKILDVERWERAKPLREEVREASQKAVRPTLLSVEEKSDLWDPCMYANVLSNQNEETSRHWNLSQGNKDAQKELIAFLEVSAKVKPNREKAKRQHVKEETFPACR
ncbi:hypothetical protein RUM44_007241 [Polyplax serrata]|uniref:Uncharacterized protein n=1 Tax=Polyplax serrata TaxID=468196 RepID=A0ABR1B057_POLSC